ncbi:kinesin motor domain containing protein [Plasmodium knowlesi strain H]|uniref:Kinesin motor domain containing protein n=3 Tax=Plasmodium knowlesi TaxID=5850 RepID=A0A5K1VMM1_PLAKH|nr:kinesin, putative [Plasmodium knowlesi strain H]OTN63622.1 Kinesin motor domain containing protein [Plasmodium knowlesi]CAA9991250.1 kinesin, putative [Plasmodium knowlesi strain H]SBO26328.1 kinesin motor domain containing protein [Plasmodium knowlesi strain H]SBO29043.1 kinesin motor domain containing protein [Plasmodium knowlesi strain H]VVS80724.1 kinesin, putative [Plasmodium knowlesi strain H]|eukprot:XP_002262529.1 Kinesin motor domain containing protein [Plasmodium knowlesi strain H]
MVFRINKDAHHSSATSAPKERNANKGGKVSKERDGHRDGQKDDHKDIHEWYIENNIEEKKKKNEEIERDKNAYFEDAEVEKNVEEYISVVCRIKNNVNEKEDGWKTKSNDVDVIKKVAQNKLVIDTCPMGNQNSGLNLEYTYDRVYDIENSNQMIFNDYIKQNIKNIFQGINCSIMAYGQTNSGKTYTMLGNFEYLNKLFHLCKENQNNKMGSTVDNDIAITYEELTNCISNEPNFVGLIPHCINYIFNYINYHKSEKEPPNGRKEFVVTMSILEIYNEIIYDLISGESNLSVHMIDSNKNEFVIKNLKEVEIENVISALHYLEEGVNNRKIAFTHMNKASSRSHLIFIIKINRYIHATNTVRCGKLCLVDLAGSERLKQTKATGSVKIETTMINKSLTVLSKVINALAVMQIKEKMDKTGKEKPPDHVSHLGESSSQAPNNDKPDAEESAENQHHTDPHKQSVFNPTKKAKVHGGSTPSMHIPYRDSKLTRVLSDSLGNNCKSILICTLSSKLHYLNETASTIKFAQRAKMVKAKPVVREEKMDTKDDKENYQNKKKENENSVKEKAPDIFLNFNKNHITKDIIFFSFSLCIFSYICGFKSTGKVKYLDFFIESYKNKIDIIREQLCKEGTDTNDVNQCILKTFDELKLLTEEEKEKYLKTQQEKVQSNNVEELQRVGKKHNHLQKIIGYKYLGQAAITDATNGTNGTNATNGTEGKIAPDAQDLSMLKGGSPLEEEEDALIGDILIKMKNDICNILKFNLANLRSNLKEDGQMFDEMLNIVNSVKENNNIFLLNELNHLSKVDAKGYYPDGKKQVEQSEGNNSLYKEISHPTHDPSNHGKGKANGKDKQSISDRKGDHKGGKKWLRWRGNHVEKEEEVEQQQEQVELYQPEYFARNILSVQNIQNIFEYVNNNYTKFISDFTTDKSTVFTNFDLKENLDRQIIEKNNTIYNFIHSATMFQHSGTLKDLNSNYFFNKIQTELFNNYGNHHNANFRCIHSMLEGTAHKEDLAQSSKGGHNKAGPAQVAFTNDGNNLCTDVYGAPNQKKYFSIKDIQPEDPSDIVHITTEINQGVKFASIKGGVDGQVVEKTVNFVDKENPANPSELPTGGMTPKQNKKNEQSPRNNIRVSQNKLSMNELANLIENEDFKKLYEYITERDNKNEGVHFNDGDEASHVPFKALESRINQEIQKINDYVTVEISPVNGGRKNKSRSKVSWKKNGRPSTEVKPYSTEIAKKDEWKNSKGDNNGYSTGHQTCDGAPVQIGDAYQNYTDKKTPNNFNHTHISYLEKKRTTNLFFQKIINIIKNIFQKKEYPKEPIEINTSDLIDNELFYNKKLLEKNLDSYNIRNFQINDKKIYLLNESEYVHLRDLINYKNKMLSFLNYEYRKFKMSLS